VSTAEPLTVTSSEADSRLRILVVEHEADAGIGLVGERIGAARAQMVAVGPETGREVPRTAEGYDGVVVLGGSPSPTDETPDWFPNVRALLGHCLDREVPLLGICLGAQLLGLAAGGRTDRVPGGAEIGVPTLWRADAAAGDPLLGDLPATSRSLQWHSFEVRDLPPGSVALVRSERCAHQAFRVGRVAWGLQFHLEALAGTAVAWSAGFGDELSAVGLTAEELTAQMRAAEPELRATWAPVADRWLAVVAASRPDTSPSRGMR
jgi:GMP synthase-like glutamine amidotransferase